MATRFDLRLSKLMSEFTFFVPGKPVAKARHRTGRNGIQYKDRAAELAEFEVIRQWENAGAAHYEVPVKLSLNILHKRPGNHYKKDGTLTAEGQRHSVPTT